VFSVNLLATEDDYYMAQQQELLERHALRLAAAWSDFDMVEHAAAEVVRRFGSMNTNEHGLVRLHKEPMFTALHTACVIGYTRPYSEASGLDAKYRTYPKPEWQDLHETLFVWKERLSGELGVSHRQFVVARESDNDDCDRYVLGEVTSALKPLRHFSVLREMCADRKTLLWKECQDAIAECYPVLYHPALLSFFKPKDQR
jgi:hypothetical protein